MRGHRVKMKVYPHLLEFGNALLPEDDLEQLILRGDDFALSKYKECVANAGSLIEIYYEWYQDRNNPDREHWIEHFFRKNTGTYNYDRIHPVLYNLDEGARELAREFDRKLAADI